MNETSEKRPPGRPHKDPSGRQLRVGFGLSPRHVEILDREAAARGVSRSELIARLLEQATGAAAKRRAPEEFGWTGLLDEKCHHPRTDVIAGGMKKCRDCDAVRGQGGEWRKP